MFGFVPIYMKQHKMNKYYVTIAILVEADDYKDVYKMDFAKELGNYGEDFLIVDVQQFYE